MALPHLEFERRYTELYAVVSPEIMHLAKILQRLAYNIEECASAKPEPVYMEQAVAIASKPEIRTELLQAIDLLTIG